MHREHEIRISEFEHARNDAMDKYFEARPQMERTRDRERVFEAGYRMAWEFLMPKIMEYEPLILWAFAWSTGHPRPFVTRMTGYTRKDCMKATEKELGMEWKDIYRQGGRLIRCTLMPNK